MIKTNRVAIQMTLLLVAAVAVLAGCAGRKTFNNYARAGDTVAVATGWNHKFQSDNIQVTITDSASNPPTTYTAPDPHIRGVVNFYPDPVSSMVLSDRLQTDITVSSKLYASLINTESTDVGADDIQGGGGGGDGEWDRDWWQTVVFVDLPATMALGDAHISVTDLGSAPNETASSTVTIVAGTGGPNTFAAKVGTSSSFIFDMSSDHFKALERAEHFVVEFSGSTVPAAIQLDLTHDPDAAHSGTGTPYVVNPTGTIKSVAWAPTGTTGTDLRVILTPTTDGEIINMTDFKFYVAGGVNNVAPNNLTLEAYDADGNAVPGVSAMATHVN